MKNTLRLCILLLLILSIISCNSSGQSNEEIIDENNIINNDTVSLLFLGDIMQHDLQIQSAYVPEKGNYDFSSQFKYVKPIFDTTDIVIGNLEVTIGGPPYKGYPRFSSPDELAYEIKRSGINYLVTANNHMYDKGKTGFEKTLKLLDSIDIKRTGTFLNDEDKKNKHPMIIEKNNIKLAIFNYTYGLNGNIPVKPSIINTLNKEEIIKDIKKAKTKGFDAIIMVFHWGKEYQRHPNAEQISLANECFENGADIIIGSHPHVIQRMEHKTFEMKNGNKKDVLTAYSLGNFVSNYGTWENCDGGVMVRFSLTKDENKNLKILDPKYHLIWVYREPKDNKLKNYYVLPISEFENNNNLKKSDEDQMKKFIKNSRSLYKSENINVPEYKK